MKIKRCKQTGRDFEGILEVTKKMLRTGNNSERRNTFEKRLELLRVIKRKKIIPSEPIHMGFTFDKISAFNVIFTREERATLKTFVKQR